MKRHSFIFFLFVVLTGSLSTYGAMAQPKYPAHIFEGGLVLGSHAIGGEDALQDRLYGLDLSYQKDLNHFSDSWVKMVDAKAVGGSFIYRNLNHLKGFNDTSANSFGQAYGVAAHIDFQLFKSGGTALTIRPAIGLSYLTKTFFTNKSNRFIGSHLNEILKLDLLVQVPVSARVEFTAGGGFLHYSNGGFKRPNHGLNMLSVSTGFRLKGASVAEKEYHSNFRPLGRSSFELSLGVGRRGVSESQKGVLKSGVYAGYNFFLNDVLSLKSGLDAVYSYPHSNTPFNAVPGENENYGTSYDNWRTGLSLGAELTMWRLAISVQAGKYLHNSSDYKDISWFWNSGVAYQISPHVAIQVKPYFHGGRADFINYGLAFKL